MTVSETRPVPPQSRLGYERAGVHWPVRLDRVQPHPRGVATHRAWHLRCGRGCDQEEAARDASEEDQGGPDRDAPRRNHPRATLPASATPGKGRTGTSGKPGRRPSAHRLDVRSRGGHDRSLVRGDQPPGDAASDKPSRVVEAREHPLGTPVEHRSTEPKVTGSNPVGRATRLGRPCRGPGASVLCASAETPARYSEIYARYSGQCRALHLAWQLR
jgi:hypothetical protein